jgi:hypothetical protein
VSSASPYAPAATRSTDTNNTMPPQTHRFLAHTQACCRHMQLRTYVLGFPMNRFAPDSVGVHGSQIHHSAWFLRVPTSSTLQPLASPTTLAGLDYLHYPHAEAFGMPVPSIHGTLIYSTSEYLTAYYVPIRLCPSGLPHFAGYTSAAPTR